MEHQIKSIYRVQALERALDILDTFSFHQRKMHLSDVVSQLGLKKPTAKRLLANLADRGYLKYDPHTKEYELGIRLFQLGGIVHDSFSIRKAAVTPMRKLRNNTGLSILMGQNHEDHLVYVDKHEGTSVIKIASAIGERRPLHFGMLGQIIMAYLPEEKVRQLLTDYPLQGFTPDSIVDQNLFFQRLTQIRGDGFLIEKGEAHKGIMGIAAPIYDASRKVVAALGAALPLPDYEDEAQVNTILRFVREAAESISSQLGYLTLS